jgi:hypothetical protein
MFVVRFVLDDESIVATYMYDVLMGDLAAFSTMIVIAHVYHKFYHAVAANKGSQATTHLIGSFKLTAWRTAAVLILLPFFRMS